MHTSRGLRMSAFRRGVITTIALAAVLAGCTDEPPGPVPQPTSAPPTIAPSPTPTPIAAPVRPEAMNTASVDGAIAAAKYFMEVYTYATLTGELADWNAGSDPGCEFCATVTSGIKEVSEAGNRTVGTAVVVNRARGTEITPQALYSATLDVTEAPSSQVDASGMVLQESSGGEQQLYLALGWNGGWVLKALDVNEAPSAP